MRRLLLAPLWIALAAPALGADESVGFRADVAPILVAKCLGCHDDRKAEGGLNMATFALLKRGGKTAGDLILEPGDPDSSTLVELVRPGGAPRMPYKQTPLSAAEIRILERWVEQGARFDGPSETETRIASLVDPLKDLPKVAVKVPTSEPIRSATFSPDGKVLAAARGREVLLFDPASGQVTSTLADHPGPVAAVLITPDGKTLIAAGGRPGMFGAVTIWDLETKTRRADLRGHADAILSATLSPDGKTLATASYDTLITLWDVAAAHEVRTLKEHTDAVHGVAFSADGKTLASASADRTVKLWDPATGKRLVTLSDATAEQYAVAFGPGGQTVLAGGVDRTIRAWAVSGTSATVARSAIAHDAAILRLVVSPDGSTLYSGGEDKAVKVWSLATLAPKAALGPGSDWPMALAISPDGSRLAVGRYDGSLNVVTAATGQVALALLDAPGTTKPMPPAKPELSRNASLGPPSPRGAKVGATVRLTLSGNGVGRSAAVVFDEPGLVATIVPAETPGASRLDVDLAIAADARIGIHRFWVQTPLGVPDAQTFAVWADAEAAEAEPNDNPARAPVVPLPATLAGTIERPGDVDYLRLEVKTGQELVFEDMGRALGSLLSASLALLDEQGHIVAEADAAGVSTLAYRVPGDGTLTLRVADAQFGGSGGHFYRILAGRTPALETAFPLGVERGRTAPVAVTGRNLGAMASVPIAAPADAEAGTLLEVPVVAPDGRKARGGPRVVVAEGPQAVEAEPNDEPDRAHPVAVPGGISGRIDAEGDVDHVRFEARKGERLVVEVYGRRLGSPIDPVLEILDAQGRPVPRAVLRRVAETTVAFRDHTSSQDKIRLTQWNELAIDDDLLVGREVIRLQALPKNPDDDATFWGAGGRRLAYLETTPEQHPMGQAVSKVEIHPPGTTFPPGGPAPVTIPYRNDDGGPGFDKDARVTFDAPADGTYIARVQDVRGSGGARFGYHLVIRRPRPDFRPSLDTENPNVPRGGTALVTVRIDRLDGFDDPVEVAVEGLPPGVTASPARIERGDYAADLVLMADATAPALSPPSWRVTARSAGGSAAGAIRHDLDPGGPRAGWVGVTAPPNLTIAATPDRVEIRPGQTVEVTLAVERAAAFSGRVPIDVRNLPHGVRVLNIGLNGVLVTEAQARRTISLYAEPWVGPTRRPFFAVGKAEAAGTEHSSPPIPLVVLPAAPDSRASASSGAP
jgi:WD40 repeat protein